MTLARTVRAETLDALAPEDPDARRSRRDLARVHLAMGTRGILARALAEPPAAAGGASRGGPGGPGDPGDGPRDGALDVLELGAGDGTLMLAVARRVATRWPPVRLTLLDRVDVVADATRDGYASLGWEVEVATVDVLDWARNVAEPRRDAIVTSLFLHHFEGAALDALLHAIAARTDRFVAYEPRRDRLALAGSRLVGALGANAVTRGDAVLSVHAGFRDDELSGRWPDAGAGWRLDESRAGPFGHRLDARRVAA